jgi:hypothetical protein
VASLQRNRLTWNSENKTSLGVKTLRIGRLDMLILAEERDFLEKELREEKHLLEKLIYESH